MRIAVYSLTRDRVEYTQRCFTALREKAGHPYDHYVVDNGSIDGTASWLLSYQPYRMVVLPKNVGISKGSNLALDMIHARGEYDLIIKVDNDCLIHTDGILFQFAEAYKHLLSADCPVVLGAHVLGLAHPPRTVEVVIQCGVEVQVTPIIGGIFRAVPAWFYAQYRYPENLPYAKGQDDHFCHWAKTERGALVGRLDWCQVEHIETTDGQCARYPEYFKRKWAEEKLVPDA